MYLIQVTFLLNMLSNYWVFLQGFAFSAIRYFNYGVKYSLKLKSMGEIPIGPKRYLDHWIMVV